MNSGSSDPLPPGFLNRRWSDSVDPSSQFRSALSPLVSSQVSNSVSLPESFRFSKLGRELQGADSTGVGASRDSPPKIEFSKLGDIHRHQHGAPGGLPAAGKLAMAHFDHVVADPGFAERAATFSSFDSRNYMWLSRNIELLGNGMPLSSSSSQLAVTGGLQIGRLDANGQITAPDELQLEIDNSELGLVREETSLSDPISASGEASFGGPRVSNAKKRKSSQKSKEKEVVSQGAPEDDSDMKRRRSAEHNDGIEDRSVKLKLEPQDDTKTNGNCEQKQGKESSVKSSEPPKDYIHVRARRGQATDSHSLAERVRREKISQRMKLLQDLVPGCSKVTGKAVMLDEIINYVQSLQRQVEFLSMKLATVNPRLDFNNLATPGTKDMIQICGTVPNSVYPFEMSMLSYANDPQQKNPLHSVASNAMDSHCSLNILDPNAHQSFLDGFGDISSQLGAFWEDDLHSMVQMGIGQNHEIVASSQYFHGGTLPTAQMKTEF